MYSFIIDESTPTQLPIPAVLLQNPRLLIWQLKSTGENSSRDLALLDIPTGWKQDAIRKNQNPTFLLLHRLRISAPSHL
ncbi:predicted protein [Sclerotinia sclerotiorum 1980 UF-70]|uniref:Uncharacterized protein n=1 Tax=Sclerotinia sclerotiorum (strain ATCC 18683 / 1980 / Ss-1) TaxID=665079 RepID=A7EQB2_SCLS1|nr:predicted protein [Sclerotinia sclerotiorum 1980 UF-70]EDO05028.1 predicted protein [Sclerotinia sclerotiorum 1980 UF-70]